MQTIRALYDITNLGMTQLQNGLRTGVARVVEELARSLQTVEGCELILMSNDFQGAAFDFAQTHLPGLAFAQSPWQIALSRWLYQYCYPIDLMYSSKRDHEPLTRATRLAIKAFLALPRPRLRHLNDRTLQSADLLHFPSGMIPAQFCGGQRSLPPLFVTVHDLILWKYPEYVPQARAGDRDRLLAGLSPRHWYICDSENTRADLLETGRCDPAQAFVAPLAASEHFRPQKIREAEIRARYQLGDDPYLLSVCTLEPRKNLDAVIRAFSRLVRESKSNLPDRLKLVLVGTLGWKHREINQAYADAGEARERIIFTGYAPEADLPAIYSNALAFVYFSLYEGFGLPLLEAMQCGAPVISSNTSSLPEVVGDAGFMHDPKDEDGFTQSMLQVCRDATLRTEMSRKSLAQAATFSWKHCAESTFAAYHSALE